MRENPALFRFFFLYSLRRTYSLSSPKIIFRVIETAVDLFEMYFFLFLVNERARENRVSKPGFFIKFSKT